jgi:phage shock protein A
VSDVMTRIRELAEIAWQEVAVQPMNAERELNDLLEAQRKQMEENDLLLERKIRQAAQLREQIGSAEELAARRSEQAELAMRAGEEDLARLALQERLHAEAVSGECRARYAQIQDEILVLAEELQQLRIAYAEACERRGYDAARIETAKQQRRLHAQSAAQDSLRSLQHAGREVGRDVSLALRQAGRISRDSLREAGGILQRELHEMRGKLARSRR